MIANPYECVPLDELRGRVRAIGTHIQKLKQERREIQAELERRAKRIITQVSPGMQAIIVPASIKSQERFGKI